MTEPIATSSSPQQLDYGLAAPRRARRVRRFVFLLLAVGLAYACWQWGPAAMQQVPILFWQRQCMHYTAPADQVVYEEDPAEAKRLLADPTQYVAYKLNRGGAPDSTPEKTTAAALHFPRCWQRFSALSPPRFRGGFGQIGTGSGAILFLHERTSSAGNRRLVCLRYYAETYSFTPSFINDYNCDTQVYALATLTAAPSPANQSMSVDVISGFPRHPPRVRIYAGQIDPNDAAHFTIRYEMWGKSDILDGRLNNDDSVTLHPRHSPVDD
jgi:hypothetical protein